MCKLAKGHDCVICEACAKVFHFTWNEWKFHGVRFSPGCPELTDGDELIPSDRTSRFAELLVYGGARANQEPNVREAGRRPRAASILGSARRLANLSRRIRGVVEPLRLLTLRECAQAEAAVELRLRREEGLNEALAIRKEMYWRSEHLIDTLLTRRSPQL